MPGVFEEQQGTQGEWRGQGKEAAGTMWGGWRENGVTAPRTQPPAPAFGQQPAALSQSPPQAAPNWTVCGKPQAACYFMHCVFLISEDFKNTTMAQLLFRAT